MKLYNEEKKEILKLKVELAMVNLSRCMAFVAGLDITDATNYEFNQLRKEYLILKDLREYAAYSMGLDEDLVVCDADYLLIKKWYGLNLQTYKSCRER